MRLLLPLLITFLSFPLLADQAADLMAEMQLIQKSTPEGPDLPEKVEELFNSSHLKVQAMVEDTVDMGMSGLQKGQSKPQEARNLDTKERQELEEMLKELDHDQKVHDAKTKTHRPNKSGWRVR